MLTILVWILAIAAAITVHEAAHAWMADRLGDPTARLAGRLSLNPLAHYDRVGTTILLITAFLSTQGFFPFPFGWAKPVMYDPYNLKDPQRDAALISLSGPAANLILALFLALAIRFIPTPFSPINFLLNLFYPIIILNVSLAIFNLIPVHPLDGGKILVGFLPKKEGREASLFLNRYGLILLVFLIFPTFGGASILSLVISPVINFILRLLLPTASFI
jgi:Zn-dependent protease